LTALFLDFGMASGERILPFQSSTSSSVPAATLTIVPAPKRHFTRAPVRSCKMRPLFAGVAKVEQLFGANHFPVVESPKYVFSAESRFQTEKEIVEACGGAGPLPFLLKGSTIYTLSPLTRSSGFACAIKADCAPSHEQFAGWLWDAKTSRWAIELLDRVLRLHAWKRGLRFDEGHTLFYFTRSKPKKLWWENGGKIFQREVTAPLIKQRQIDNHRLAEFQRGWKHEAIRAGFVQWGSSLFVRFEPAWFLTELDGKTPATSQTVAPLDSSRLNRKDADTQRTLCFWSAVFAKSHRELRIETGAGPIRVKLTPSSSSAPRIIPKVPTNLNHFALTDMEEDGPIPELAPVEV